MWRREYRNGRLAEAEKSTTSLMPVVVSATSLEAGIVLSGPVCPEPAAPTGAIDIEFPGRATISVEHSADGSLLRRFWRAFLSPHAAHMLDRHRIAASFSEKKSQDASLRTPYVSRLLLVHGSTLHFTRA